MYDAPAPRPEIVVPVRQVTLGLSEKQLCAIGAVLDIALHGGAASVQSGDITERQGIPRRYLEPVLQQLSRSGLIVGVRGPQGGYRLARERRRITLGELVRAVSAREKGKAVRPDEHREPPERHVVSAVLSEIETDVMQRLDAVTVEDMCWRVHAAQPQEKAATDLDFTI